MSSAVEAPTASTAIAELAKRLSHTASRLTGRACSSSSRPASSSPEVSAEAVATAIADSSSGSISAYIWPSR